MARSILAWLIVVVLTGSVFLPPQSLADGDHGSGLPPDYWEAFQEQYIPLMGVRNAWNTTWGSPSIILCIPDRGVAFGHQDMSAARILPGRDFVDDDYDAREARRSKVGTFLAGVAAAGMRDGIYAGIVEATVLPVRVHSGTTMEETKLEQGIIYCADEGADVILLPYTLAYGGKRVDAALEYASERDALIIAPVAYDGDATRPCDGCRKWPSWDPVVIGVGGTRADGSHAPWSAMNEDVELVAPGKAIFGPLGSGGWGSYTGTGPAASLVAGVVALVRSEKPWLDAEKTRLLMHQSAEDMGSPGRDRATGFGMVRADRALLNQPPTVLEFDCGASTIVEDQPVECALEVTDDSPALQVRFSWGTETWFEFNATTEDLPLRHQLTHTYSEPGTYVITLSASDHGYGDSQRVVMETTIVVEENDAPGHPEVHCPQRVVTVGRPLNCELQVLDDSAGVYYLVDWDDGTPVQRAPSSGYVRPDRALKISRTYDSAGERVVSIQVYDNGAPPLSSDAASMDVLVTECSVQRSSMLLSPLPDAYVDSVNIAWEDIPASCSGGGIPFSLSATGPVPGDFDVCWYAETGLLDCHRSTGLESAVIPSGATRARVELVEGFGAHYTLLAPWAQGN